MPAIITHYLFGKEVQKNTGREPAFSSIYNWGVQGPDVLFFSPPLSQDGRRLLRTGSVMHERDVEANLAFFCDYYRAASGTAREALTSYLYGYLAHYILDSTMHPFVYGMQRYFKKKLPRAGENYLHRKIETNLDVLFLKRLRNTTIRDYSISSRLQFKPELDAVCKMYGQLLRENYNIGIGSGLIHRSFCNMKTVYSFLYSPGGFKRNLLSAVEHATGHLYPEYAALAHTSEPTNEIDYANMEKSVHEPGNEALEYNAFELLDAACLRYRDAAGLLSGFLKNGGGDFHEITRGINFEGNRGNNSKP